MWSQYVRQQWVYYHVHKNLVSVKNSTKYDISLKLVILFPNIPFLDFMSRIRYKRRENQIWEIARIFLYQIVLV